MSQTDVWTRTKGVKQLHLILLVSLALIAVAFVLVVQSRGQLLVPDSGTTVIGYAFAGIGLTAIAFGILFFRPRVEPRPPGLALEEYWTAQARGRAMAVWILIDNGGIFAATGYLITGELAAGAVAGIAVLALAWFSPARLADE